MSERGWTNFGWTIFFVLILLGSISLKSIVTSCILEEKEVQNKIEKIHQTIIVERAKISNTLFFNSLIASRDMAWQGKRPSELYRKIKDMCNLTVEFREIYSGKYMGAFEVSSSKILEEENYKHRIKVSRKIPARFLLLYKFSSFFNAHNQLYKLTEGSLMVAGPATTKSIAQEEISFALNGYEKVLELTTPFEWEMSGKILSFHKEVVIVDEIPVTIISATVKYNIVLIDPYFKTIPSKIPFDMLKYRINGEEGIVKTVTIETW
ncbi:MAG: hypothetical protein ACE5K4_07215 [Candidatus Hydrothermarchaeota archaeon]